MSVDGIRLTEVDCDLCGGASKKPLYSMPDLRMGVFDQSYDVMECRGCGHRFLSPRPIRESIPALYPESYYEQRGGGGRSQGHTFSKRTGLLPIESGAILDVGCAGGEWLLTLGKKWKRTGLDFIPPKHPTEDFEIVVGELPDAPFDDGSFDVVTAWGSLEHVESPSACFDAVRRILRPGGFFVFLVPNGDSLWSRRAYKEDIPRHLHFFRRKTVAQYARKHGFEVENVSFPDGFYSKRPSARGLFKRAILLKTGLSWERILAGDYGGWRRPLGAFGTFLDLALITLRWKGCSAAVETCWRC